MPAVRLAAGAAARFESADQRDVSCPTGLAPCKAGSVSAPSGGWLSVRAPWHVPAPDAGGDADRAVLLSDRPRDLQSAAGLSCQSVPWRARRPRTGGGPRRACAQYRSGRRCPPARHRLALGRALGAAAADARPRDAAGRGDARTRTGWLRGARGPRPHDAGHRSRARHLARPRDGAAARARASARIRAPGSSARGAPASAPTRGGG